MRTAGASTLPANRGSLLRRCAECKRVGIESKLIPGGERPLDCIFQLAERLLGVRERIETRSSSHRVLDIGILDVEAVSFSDANRVQYRPPLTLLCAQEMFRLREFFQRRDVHRERPLAVCNGIGLSLEECGGGLLPPRLGLRNGALISIEQRNDG